MTGIHLPTAVALFYNKYLLHSEIQSKRQTNQDKGTIEGLRNKALNIFSAHSSEKPVQFWLPFIKKDTIKGRSATKTFTGSKWFLYEGQLFSLEKKKLAGDTT